MSLWRRRLLRCLAALALGCALTAAYAHDATIAYYDITGHSADALRRAMKYQGTAGRQRQALRCLYPMVCPVALSLPVHGIGLRVRQGHGVGRRDDHAAALDG